MTDLNQSGFVTNAAGAQENVEHDEIESQPARTDPLANQLRSALDALHDIKELERHPLAFRLAGKSESTPELRARRLQRWLVDAINKLRPENPGRAPDSQESRWHTLLNARYIEGLEPEVVWRRIGHGRSSFFRHVSSGIDELARQFRNETSGGPDAIPPLISGGYESEFVGREQEFSVLKALYNEVASGAGGRVAMITGEEGIGKTRLARELGKFVEKEGGLFLEGRWAAWEGAAPYGALADSLRQGIRQLDPEEVDFAVGPYRRELTRILPELAEKPESRTDETAQGVEGEQLRFYDGVFWLVQNLSQKQPLVLLLDDLHLAPQMSLQLHIARRLPELRLLIVYGFRENELAEKTALFTGRNEMVRNRLVTDIALMPITESQVEQIIANAFEPDIAAHLRNRIFEINRGNPFFVEEVLRYLLQNQMIRRSDRGWEVQDITHLGIPETVKRLVQDRVDRLGEEATSVLRQASVLGRDFRFDALTVMTQLPEDELVEVIERAVAGGVLVDSTRAAAAEEYRFRDDHVREALYDGITSPRRRRYHRAAGGALEETDPSRLQELAFHFTTGSDLERGAKYSFEAAEQANAAFSWNRAIPLYRDALDLWDELGDHRDERALAAERLGNACYKSGIQAQRATGYFQQSLDLYTELGNESKAATILSELGREHMHSGNLAAQDLNLALKHFTDAEAIISREPESIRHGMVYCGLAMVHLDRMEFRDALEWAHRAFEVGKRINAPAVIANASVPLGAATAMESVSDAADILERGWRTAIESDLGFQSDLSRAYAARVLGAMPKDPRTGIEWVNRGPRYETTYSLFDIPAHLVAFHALAGEFDEAEKHLDELQRRLAALGQPTFGPWPDELGLLWIRTGQLEHAEVQLGKALDWATNSGNRLVEAGTARRLGEVLTHLGHYEVAEEKFLHSLKLNRAGGNRIGELALLPQLAQLYCETGRFNDAENTLVRARKVESEIDAPGALKGDLFLANGIVNAGFRRIEESDNAFRSALDIYREFDRPWDEARAYYALGLVTRAISVNESDVSRSRELVGKADSLFSSIGATWWAERCRQGHA